MKLSTPTRHFVPTPFDVDSPEAVKSIYQGLLDQSPCNAEELRHWILHWSELESVLRETSARRYIAMTCDTQDSHAAKEFEHFTTAIEPISAEMSDLLKRKLLEHPAKSALDNEFSVWFRDLQVGVELFRAENIPVETQIALEVQAYQKITGGMSVVFRGEERTLPQMSPFQQDADRATREEAWRTVAQRRLLDRQTLDEAFDKLFQLRIQVADQTGYSNDFLPYIFKAKGRYDYTPKDCRDFHESIRTLVLPRVRHLMQSRAHRMGIPAPRPWDTECDPQGRSALKPFQTGQELLEKVSRIFDDLHPQMGTWFQQMIQQGLIDSESRKGKAPGGYQISLDESRVPFIFTNAAGTNGDVYTMLHEAGHSFHQFSMASQPIVGYRDTPSEFAEVASMSMEIVASTDLSPFYNDADAARSRLEQFEDVLTLLPWVAMVDSFQHELYSKPNHSAQERRDIWMQIHQRFDTGIDWSDLTEERAYLWQRQLHLFEVPFYYVEYGIAQLGALQLWANYRKNPQKALDQLLQALSFGSSRPLPELFAAAGIRFDFSAATLEPLMQEVDAEIARLEALL